MLNRLKLRKVLSSLTKEQLIDEAMRLAKKIELYEFRDNWDVMKKIYGESATIQHIGERPDIKLEKLII